MTTCNEDAISVLIIKQFFHSSRSLCLAKLSMFDNCLVFAW